MVLGRPFLDKINTQVHIRGLAWCIGKGYQNYRFRLSAKYRIIESFSLPLSLSLRLKKPSNYHYRNHYRLVFSGLSLPLPLSVLGLARYHYRYCYQLRAEQISISLSLSVKGLSETIIASDGLTGTIAHLCSVTKAAKNRGSQQALTKLRLL